MLSIYAAEFALLYTSSSLYTPHVVSVRSNTIELILQGHVVFIARRMMGDLTMEGELLGDAWLTISEDFAGRSSGGLF